MDDNVPVGALVEVGFVARPHGVRGELRVVPHQPGSQTLLRVRRVVVGAREHEVTAARAVEGAFLVKLGRITDRDAAEELRGEPVAVDREDILVERGEVLLADLVGCRVELDDGTPYGEVEEIQPGFQDRLVIVDGDVERLLPLVDAFVVEIDTDGRRVVVRPPEGLPETRRT